jgi:hypothetical protein
MLSINNIFFSIAFFVGCSIFMSIFGDALAWHRMPVYETIDEAKSHILRDLGHELIPYTCDVSFIKRNIQTTVILFSLPAFLVRCYFLNIQYINKFLFVAGIIMILRTLTMMSTAYPNPNPQCYDESINEISYSDAILQTITSFPPRSCGNLMFSGHTMFLTLFFCFETRFLYTHWFYKVVSLFKTLFGLYFIIACRSHYTADVLVSILITCCVFKLFCDKTENYLQMKLSVGEIV